MRAELAKYLPWPTVEFDGERYWLDYDRPESIGKVRSYLGAAPVILRAFAWCLMMGPDGLRETAEISVLNNNYLIKKLEAVPGLSYPYARGHRRLEEVRWSWEKLHARHRRRHRRHPSPTRATSGSSTTGAAITRGSSRSR